MIFQAAGVCATVMLLAGLHVHNDGLWFQGDAPRHAINGLFWWDFLRALPADPVTFALSYYARYPVIAPATYPPLFYTGEGLAFSLFGASPHVAKGMVLLLAVVAGLYTSAWARRWIGPAWGWAGAFLAFVPGMLVWSNTVMLNVPATALGLGCLYHFRRWLETRRKSQLVAAVISAAALMLTYYQGASVLGVCLAWLVLLRKWHRVSLRPAHVAGAVLIALVPILLVFLLAPVQLTRHLPIMRSLIRVGTWSFYWTALPEVVGIALLLLAATSMVVLVAVPRCRLEGAYLASWIVALITTFSLLPAKDPRYILLVAPAFVLIVTAGLSAVTARLSALSRTSQLALLTLGLGTGFWSATLVHVPRVTGFREVAEYLRQHGPTDAVLYDGTHDGIFGFYVRAMDPQFERRMVRADKLLYEYGPTTTFRRVERSNIASTADVANWVRMRSGCRWVALEMGIGNERLAAQRLLRKAVATSDFELVRSFPVTAADTHRVELYRVVGPIPAVTSVDLTFPAFSERTFGGVAPITR